MLDKIWNFLFGGRKKSKKRTEKQMEIPPLDYGGISLIFYAICMGGQRGGVKFQEIIRMADGINRSIPAQKVMQTAIKWLLKNELVEKEGKKYRPSTRGLNIYEEIKSESSNDRFERWNKLKWRIKKIHVETERKKLEGE